VRTSFALSYWAKLAEDYPPALEKLLKFRDYAIKEVKEGRKVFQNFHDLVAINRTVGEDAVTREVFAFLHAYYPTDAKRVFIVAEPSLIRAKAYQLCNTYLDPDQSYRIMAMGYQSDMKYAKTNNPSHMRTFGEPNFTSKVTTLVALLVVNGRKAEAERVVADAKKEWDDAAFHSKLEDALKGNVPEPWPPYSPALRLPKNNSPSADLRSSTTSEATGAPSSESASSGSTVSASAKSVQPETSPPSVADAALDQAKRIPGWGCSWSPDSKFLVRQGSKVVSQVAGGALEVIEVATGKNRNLVGRGKDPAWSPRPDGPIAYVEELPDGQTSVWIVQPDGSQPRRVSDGSFVSGWSSDGTRIYDYHRKSNSIRSVDWSSSTPSAATLVVLPEISANYPCVSPDGRLVAFASPVSGLQSLLANQRLVVWDISTSKQIASAPIGGWKGLLCGWSPDSRRIAYGDFGSGNVGLWVLDVATEKSQKRINRPFTMPRWSPDGQWFAMDDRVAGELLVLPAKEFDSATGATVGSPR